MTLTAELFPQARRGLAGGAVVTLGAAASAVTAEAAGAARRAGAPEAASLAAAAATLLLTALLARSMPETAGRGYAELERAAETENDDDDDASAAAARLFEAQERGGRVRGLLREPLLPRAPPINRGDSAPPPLGLLGALRGAAGGARPAPRTSSGGGALSAALCAAAEADAAAMSSPYAPPQPQEGLAWSSPTPSLRGLVEPPQPPQQQQQQRVSSGDNAAAPMHEAAEDDSAAFPGFTPLILPDPGREGQPRPPRARSGRRRS